MAGEFDLIRRYFARPVAATVLGPGDDCALIEPSPGMQLAVTTDMLVAGTHFLADTDPRDLGWKTLAVNLSDLAAMGARARWVTLAGSLPAADEAWLAPFADGFFACAAAYGVDVIGGDTTRGPLNLCVTALGEVAPGQALRRAAAQAGDDIWVSGRPGFAALGLRQLRGEIALPGMLARLCVAALQRPRPRLELGLALLGLAHAAIDVSDGLLADLGHIASASGLAADVFLVQLPHLPEGVDRATALACQLGGGDDYELCFAAPPSVRVALAGVAANLELPLWRIGTFTAGSGVRVLDPDGLAVDFDIRGYDHFGQ
jgi:thiamine-monophosphate kinase